MRHEGVAEASIGKEPVRIFAVGLVPSCVAAGEEEVVGSCEVARLSPLPEVFRAVVPVWVLDSRRVPVSRRPS